MGGTHEEEGESVADSAAVGREAVLIRDHR